MDEAVAIERASQLGGIAYLAELVMRLFAHRTPGLDKHTHEISTVLENEFFNFLGDSVSESQKTQIRDCRDFRNKLLHTRWWKDATDEEYKQRFEEVKSNVALIRKLSGLDEMTMLSTDPKEIDWNSLGFIEKYVFCNYRNIAIASTAYEIVRECPKICVTSF